MQYLEPSLQSWLLTYLRGNLPSTFSVEAGALPSSTQHCSPPISRNAKFASSVLLSIRVDYRRYQQNDNEYINKGHSHFPLQQSIQRLALLRSSNFGQLLMEFGQAKVRFVWLIPVTSSELEFKRTKGLAALERMFEKVKCGLLGMPSPICGYFRNPSVTAR